MVAVSLGLNSAKSSGVRTIETWPWLSWIIILPYIIQVSAISPAFLQKRASHAKPLWIRSSPHLYINIYRPFFVDVRDDIFLVIFWLQILRNYHITYYACIHVLEISIILYSISQEICTRFLLCCALLWLYIDWFSHIHQTYFTGTVAI